MRNIKQMRKDFREDFDLNYAEEAIISRPQETQGFEERVKNMDEIRKEMKKAIKPRALRKCLFAYNGMLEMSYFDAMRQGKFEEVLGNIGAFNEGVFI